MSFVRLLSSLEPYVSLQAYAGDLHNHCGISYGHGTIEDAYRNARLQLDFASVTGHASWHDMPAEPARVNRYHRHGFERLRAGWEHVQDVTESANRDGEFVSLLSFEWHSMTYGDHCVYFNGARGPLEPASATTLEDLRQRLRQLSHGGLDTMVLPHHIGYQAGRRGINWATYTEELSPVVELVSMHGSGESDAAPRNYLHTMGPRDAGSTALHGLRAGHVFGFIGSTDHHSAHPGSNGYGRAMVWAKELTRDGVWEAIRARRTYAVTGDRIMLATTVNGAPMGSIITTDGAREIAIDVLGSSAVDYVELVRNGEVIARESPAGGPGSSAFDGMLAVSVGWGEVGRMLNWNVELQVIGGRIEAVDPRFHGYDVVAPSEHEPDSFAFSNWNQLDQHRVEFSTRSQGNPTVLTDATQQFALHVIGDEHTVLVGRFNGVPMRRSVGELLRGQQAGYLGGFLSGAMLMHRAEPRSARSVALTATDAGTGSPTDWYYARVRQHNDQYAWSSPTWVHRSKS